MKKELSHEKDVRGFQAPFEPPDGITIRRIVTAVMVAAVGVLIVAVVVLGLAFKASEDRAAAERVVAAGERRQLREQLERSTRAITGLLEFQAAETADAKKRTAAAIEAVVERVNGEVRKTITETHEPLVDEHQRIIDAVESP